MNFSKGLQTAGHQLVAVGRGFSSASDPIGAISAPDLRKQINSDVPICDVLIDSILPLENFLCSNQHDIVIISWPKILPAYILTLGNSCFIGTHPTILPLGRGRHPLHWMRVLGLRTSKVTAFRVDPGVDSGPIIGSVRFRTRNNQSIDHDLDTVEQKHYWLGFQVGIRLWLGIPRGRPQRKKTSTTWRKRNESDTKIDFRMTAKGIIQHVRSFSYPFPLASVELSKGTEVRIESAHAAAFALFKRKNRWSALGTVLKKSQRKNGGMWILVRCFDGAVWLSLSPCKPEDVTANWRDIH